MTPERACAHCGLPVGRRMIRRTIDGMPGAYCCYGCVLAQQVTRATGDAGALSAVAIRLALAVFLTMNVLMLSMPNWVPAVYAGEETDGPLFVVLRWLALVLGAPVLVLLGWPMLRAGQARAVLLRAEGLVAVGALAAWTLSLVHLVRGRPEIYVDTACLLLVLVTVGRWVEARARASVGAVLGQEEDPGRRPVRRRGAAGSRVVPAESLVPGDVICVSPGDHVPTDGRVLAGTGTVSEALLTGEAAAVPKRAGDEVAGGTISLDGVFDVQVTAPMSASARARIVDLMRRAILTRSPSERLADRVAAFLLPLAVAIALAAGAWWTVTATLDDGLMVALAVLVVACPCALGIATPAAVSVALAAAARVGVLVRGGDVLERFARVRHIVLDKTGTLTDETPRVSAVDPATDARPEWVLAVAAALERHVSHPIAHAVRAAAEAWAAPVLEAGSVRIAPGRGVVGRVGGQEAAVEAAADGVGLCVRLGGRVLGRLHLAETVRPSAQAGLSRLRALGVGVTVLTGDRSARALVPDLLPSDHVELGLTPAGKLTRMRALAAATPGAVAMVGDGLNDAPTLAAADVGIAVASATDLTRRAADVVLLTSDLDRIPWLLLLARRAQRTIRRNLAWAVAYNAIALGLAAAGRLTPVAAALVMLASSVTIVASARRLGRAHRPSGGVDGGAGTRRTGDREFDERVGAAAGPAAQRDAAAVGFDYLTTHG